MKEKDMDKFLSMLLNSSAFEQLVRHIKALWGAENERSQQSKERLNRLLSDLEEKQARHHQPEVQPKIVEKIIKEPVLPAWAKECEPFYLVWQSLQHYPNLQRLFGHGDFVTFVACASQWDNIIYLWDELAEQCKQTQTPVSNDELNLLSVCIDLFNRTTSKPAQLEIVMAGDAYDYKKHNKLNDGEYVTSVLLPALSTSAKPYLKPAIVLCE